LKGQLSEMELSTRVHIKFLAKARVVR
jgi:hypothetical protein